MRIPRAPKMILALLAAGLLVAGVAAVGVAKMRTERIDQRLCQTTGGGRFVAIPGFPGERIDRRLLRDVRWMVRRYKVFITDGFSTDPIHSAKGEHPIGLALDIVPNKAAGGRWRDVSRLARWAEPRQNQPRPPFRWVGYNGDPNHGRGHHLHLSWAHSPAKFGKPARTVYSIRCPGARKPVRPTEPDKKGNGGKKGGDRQTTGGITPGPGAKETVGTRGGLNARKAKRKVRKQQGSKRSRETGGIGIR